MHNIQKITIRIINEQITKEIKRLDKVIGKNIRGKSAKNGQQSSRSHCLELLFR